ncbi:glycosyltransferase family 4 protein [Deefgea piscis]|uniref:glycosyltransferase family 4 protein n=1 Tax=Deefgea piscis TaxID=2739061 RepID=UPI001C803E61|nr:glycosyltransferase family 4 protein [Deefgea piscis]QZA82029.1 glycosyltransferase family 4 protein [Deefgea piscis]
MKILFAMRDALPPFRVDVKILFGKYLFNKGVSTHLVGRSKSGNFSPVEWNAGEVSVSSTDGEGKIKTFYCLLLESFFLLKFGRTADIIQVRDRIRLLPAAWLSSFLWNKPLVYWVSFPIVEGHRQVYLECKINYFLRRSILFLRYFSSKIIFYKLMPFCCDGIFVQSNAMKKAFCLIGMPEKKIMAVPMGVDLEMFSALNPDLADKKNQPLRLCYLGTIAKSRQSDFLLDVIVGVRKYIPDAQLLIVGSGLTSSEQSWFRSEIETRGIAGCVELTGWLPQNEGISLLSNADIGLSPIPRGKLFDVSSPTKAVEYLACGIPCVGNDIPDQKLVLEESGAGVCVEMNVDSFVNAIVDLWHMPDVREVMSVKARSYVLTNRNYAVLSEQVYSRYRELI